MSSTEKIIQLGDIIKIIDPVNEILNENTFIIDYIDDTQLRLINVETLGLITLKIEDGIVGNGTITNIILLSRSDEKGYAKQNGLLPGTWVNILFDYTAPLIITAEITNLEEDMIELKTFPGGDILYINFGYKGIPLDLPIKNIEIREKPEKYEAAETPALEQPEAAETPALEQPEATETQAIEQPEPEKFEEPTNVRTQLREIILKADQIRFGNEELGTVVQYVDVGKSKERYSIEDQTTDLLDDLLSTIPNIQRTESVLGNIHTMIERFKQLREQFSRFDKNGNVTPIQNKARFKPLEKYYQSFSVPLLWILPIVKNNKKLYDIDVGEEDAQNLYSLQESLEEMKEIIDNYKTNTIVVQNNKYASLFYDLNPYFTPFDSLNDEVNNEIIEKPVQCDLTVLINNSGDNFSYTSKKNNIYSKRFLMGKYNTGLTNLEASNFSGNQMTTTRNNLTNPDIMSIQSFIILPEPVIRYSRIHLPSTSLIDKSNLNMCIFNYWNIFTKNAQVKTVIIDDISEDLEFTDTLMGYKLTYKDKLIRPQIWGAKLKEKTKKAVLAHEIYVLYPTLRKMINESHLEEIYYTPKRKFEELGFANNIKEYVLNASREDQEEFNKQELYEKFVQTITPKIKTLFQLMKKYMNNQMSVVDIVSYLEPFMVYSDNLTYMQYKDMVSFIDTKISEYNTKYINHSARFQELKKIKFSIPVMSNPFSLYNLLEYNTKVTFLANYNITSNDIFTLNQSELLRVLSLKDCAKLYTFYLSMQNIKLMFPDDFNSVFENNKKEIEKSMKDVQDSCKTIIVAKFYTSEEELLLDNNKEIFFDKKYDKTQYSFLDDYEKEMENMDPDKFVTFLVAKISEKLKMNEQDSNYTAETLIYGAKKILDGQYAILYNFYQMNEENEKYLYYVRKNNVWELDESIDENVKSDIPNVLCNVQPNCISVPAKIDETCENIELNKLELQNNTMNDILSQFDEQYFVSLKEFQEKMAKNLENYKNIFDMLIQIENNTTMKYNDRMYNLGLDLLHVSSQIVSPYAKLLEFILGQSNFIKIQSDIVKFATNCTRPAVGNETKHWLYCNKTGVELLPTFRYDMANAYLIDPLKYYDYVQKLIKDLDAQKSDDGDYWVDKYTGRNIIYVGYSAEEGYNQGFRVSTRDVLEKEAGESIIPSNQTIKYTSAEMIAINNIINTISVSMGINLTNIEAQKEFIISNVTERIKTTLETKELYKTKIIEMANKGVSIPSYNVLYNSTLLYYTFGMFLIAVQTNIPSIQTKKTFPGCVKSFSGYPFDGEGDMSSLNYLACIVYKIRSPVDPWSALARMKEQSIASKIKNAVDNLLGLQNVKMKMDEKTLYLLTETTNTIPTEHDVVNWRHFLPPLTPFKITHLINISTEFKNELVEDLKQGRRKQTEKIGMIESKNIQFSLAIQEEIYNVLRKKQLLLSKSSGEPYIENSCCNENTMTTIQYFEKEAPHIIEYNNIVNENSNRLLDIRFYSEANTFSTNINTKKKFPPINKEFEEVTIYTGFIQFCHFKNLIPIGEDLLPFCNEKPDYINKTDSMLDMMQKLKNNGKNYTDKTFTRLLQMIARKNMYPIDTNPPISSSIQRLTDTLEHSIDEMIDPELVSKMKTSIDTFDIATASTTKEVKDLNNFLIRNIELMKAEIVNHISKNKGSITEKEIKMMKSFIVEMTVWADNKSNKISNDSLYNSVDYYKTFIKNLAVVYPNILLNKVEYEEVKIPTYWNLSQNHTRDIKKIIKNHYEGFKPFYNDKSLYNILVKINLSSVNFLKLVDETPSFTSIKYKDTEWKPVFDERTSKFLFEYYLFRIMVYYIELSEEADMVVKERIETDTFEDTGETNVIRGNIKGLKEKVSKLLLCFIKMMSSYKNTVDFSYEKIQDTVFKLKEKEKNMITDRLQMKSDEEREIDTLLKKNKLGDWSKGLQKGLVEYDKDYYDKEKEFRENIQEFEEITQKGNREYEREDFEEMRDEIFEQKKNAEEIDKDVFDMSFMTDDYTDGNYYQDPEEENYNDYD